MHAQVITEGMGAAYLRLKLKDQARALGMLSEDAALAGLRQLRAPLLDLEVRGLPALQYFGGMVWRDAIDEYSAGERHGGVLCGQHAADDYSTEEREARLADDQQLAASPLAAEKCAGQSVWRQPDRESGWGGGGVHLWRMSSAAEWRCAALQGAAGSTSCWAGRAAWARPAQQPRWR